MKHFVDLMLRRLDQFFGRMKKRMEYGRFYIGVVALPVIGAIGALIMVIGQPSPLLGIAYLVAACACMLAFYLLTGKQWQDGIAYKWSIQLGESYPNVRWALSTLMYLATTYAYPPLAGFYLFTWGMYFILSLLDDADSGHGQLPNSLPK
jgi:hypothetical protein